MKSYKYKGPSGEVKCEDPFLLRMVESSWFFALCALLFMGWGGYYLSFAEPEALTGRGLTPGHLDIKQDCFACHMPFRGVPNYSCSQEGCHDELLAHRSHSRWACVECHPRHTDGRFVPEPMQNSECDKCHQEEASDPRSPFHPQNKAQRRSTNVPQEIFPHGKHETSRYKCRQCHCTGRNTLQTEMEDLFKMDTCLLCKEHTYDPPRCKVCHNYKESRDTFHLKREPNPKRECLTEEEMRELYYKVQLCTPYFSRAPGFKNLTVCDTGEPALEWKP